MEIDVVASTVTAPVDRTFEVMIRARTVPAALLLEPEPAPLTAMPAPDPAPTLTEPATVKAWM